MNDEKAERVMLAIQELALLTRDQGPHALAAAARRAIDEADGPVAALIIAAALIRIDEPTDAWWQDTFPVLKICCRCDEAKTLSEFVRDESRADGLSYACRECRHDTHRQGKRASAA